MEARLPTPAPSVNSSAMDQIRAKGNRAWRKSRLAARILIRKEAGRMTKRDCILAEQLSGDAEVNNRLERAIKSNYAIIRDIAKNRPQKTSSVIAR